MKNSSIITHDYALHAVALLEKKKKAKTAKVPKSINILPNAKVINPPVIPGNNVLAEPAKAIIIPPHKSAYIPQPKIAPIKTAETITAPAVIKIPEIIKVPEVKKPAYIPQPPVAQKINYAPTPLIAENKILPPVTDWQSAIRPLLKELNWRGEERNIIEAFPINRNINDMTHFREVMTHLGFISIVMKCKMKNITKKHVPAIWVDSEHNPHLMSANHSFSDLESTKHNKITTFILFKPAKKIIASEIPSVAQILKRKFTPVLLEALIVSLLIGGVALAPTFYNMMVYDHVISSGSINSITMLLIGAVIALIVELWMRQMRSDKLCYFGARIDHFVSSMIFERLLFIPTAYTESTGVSTQLTRLRDFESVREFFTSPLASLFFEIPIVAIYLIAMVYLSGIMVVIPVVILACYCVLLFCMYGRIKNLARLSANAVSRRHEFLLESFSKLKAIRIAGMEDVWQERYNEISGKACLASFKAGFSAQILEVASYVIMTIGGIATLGFGVIAVTSQYITVGALVAAMMIIWRIVTPMQMCCASISRFQQLSASTKQVERLLTIAPEHDPYATRAKFEKIKGHITFHRVSLRYTADTEPVLLGVSFEAKPGEIVAIHGHNGSGKSTILKLMLSLYAPQSGSIRIDGIDIRQLDSMSLRQNIAYVPQIVNLFPGTIYENLLFSNPSASKEDCLRALDMACARDEVISLPRGIDTKISGENDESLSFMLRQRINLARAYVRNSSIMLFDEASYSLGKENDDAFEKVINNMRGKTTVLLVTHREDHMRLADKLIVMDKGELTMAGPPDQVLSMLRRKKL